MTFKLTYQGEVKEDGLYIINRKRFDSELLNYLGKRVEIEIRPKRKRRSVFQNAYYWGVVVPLVKAGLNDIGYKIGLEQTHELLKSKFHIVEYVNENTGEIIKAIGTTTDMTTSEMMDYFEEITQWAAEYLNIQIPQPNEQIEIEHEN
jgi:hypothetical protein